ncbi:hypothetical protein LZ32DRAFT_399076 [Colletotrichum eremochloae]|nr:hypothetical protein LZ32DRAFT_399076 [Colletotrichum eremochloae]
MHTYIPTYLGSTLHIVGFFSFCQAAHQSGFRICTLPSPRFLFSCHPDRIVLILTDWTRPSPSQLLQSHLPSQLTIEHGLTAYSSAPALG